MKTLKKILKFKLTVFPDQSYVDVKDVIIGVVGLTLYILLIQI